MKFLDNFLLKYIKNSKAEIILEQAFVDLGFEVEEIIKEDKLKDVFIGKVIDSRRHPNADKLNFCIVEKNNLSHEVICGGTNVTKDQYIAYAPSGSIVNNIQLTKKNLRGIESDGMILSVSEILGIDNSVVEEEEKENIYVFENDVDLNLDIKKYFDISNLIYDVTILNDRSYANSYLAMANEISGYYNLLFSIELPEVDNDFKIIERETKVDKFVNGYFYTEVLLKSARTPLWIKVFLYYHGIQPNNTIRDLIAYVSLITGNVFYYLDKSLNKVNIEKNFINKINLFKDDVIQNDKEEGLIFGVSSSYYGNISENKDANKDFGARQLKGTTSKYLEYGILLLVELGKKYNFIKSNSNIIGKEYKNNTKIVLDKKYLDLYVGAKINLESIREKMLILGFSFNEKDEWFISPYRKDVKTKQDLMEEIVRIYGVNNLKPKPLKLKKDGDSSYENFEKNLIFKLTHLLVEHNFSETKTYQLLSENDARKYNFWSNKKILKIRDEYNYKDNTLRASLFKSLLDVHSKNYRNDYSDINLFEISNININEQSRVHLGILHDDRYYEEEPLLATRQILIEILKKFESKFDIKDLVFKENQINIFDKFNSYKIFFNDEFIGIIGQVSVDILREYKYVRLDKIKNTLYYLELNLSFLNN